MKEKIIEKATNLFLRLGFKSITMDDIACEMCISKKTIYKFFVNKEALITESANMLHDSVHKGIAAIMQENHNPVAENFEIRRIFKGLFQSAESSPLYQLKKHYPEIFDTVISIERDECYHYLRSNIERGIAQGYYRPETNIEQTMLFYYTLIFHVNENTALESETRQLELGVLEYHTRAIATEKGIVELEKHLLTPII